MYVEEKRGAFYIGKLFNRSDNVIMYYLKKWNVPIWNRKVISKQIRKIYGPIKGFQGKEHSKESRQKISDSGKLAWQNENRVPRGGYSKTYNTIIGKVIGTYEVAFLQKLINEGKSLPKAEIKKIKTPFGMYTPDFEFEDRLIEIKSCFTIKVCKGEVAFVNQQRCDKQWKKN